MGSFRRFLSGLSGKSRHRLPNEMALLGAPAHLVDDVRRMPDDNQEEAFLGFVEGRHACILDWKADRDDVYAALQPLLTPEERQLLPAAEQLPADAAATIATVQRAWARAPRSLVHTESYGDFSVLILVPREREQEFIAAVGPWLIEHDKE